MHTTGQAGSSVPCHLRRLRHSLGGTKRRRIVVSKPQAVGMANARPPISAWAGK